MMKWKKAPPALIESFIRTFARDQAVEKRKMFGYPCCFINGQMFTGLHQESWVLRLSPEDRENFLQRAGAKIFEPMKGRLMKEYAVIPGRYLKNSRFMKKWIEKSKRYALTLPPKDR
jgi:TfoX/Sxy family transcriptional regulator of competence genes